MITGIDDSDMGKMYLSSVCNLCKHLTSTQDQTCEAFPKGIPAVIWRGDNDHTKPFKGDNGIQFEAIEKGS